MLHVLQKFGNKIYEMGLTIYINGNLNHMKKIYNYTVSVI